MDFGFLQAQSLNGSRNGFWFFTDRLKLEVGMCSGMSLAQSPIESRNRYQDCKFHWQSPMGSKNGFWVFTGTVSNEKL